jgi:hypothetical protein
VCLTPRPFWSLLSLDGYVLRTDVPCAMAPIEGNDDVESVNDDDDSSDSDDINHWSDVEDDGDDGMVWDEDVDGDDEDDDDSISVIDEIGDDIVGKFILTFSNGDYDAKFDDKLSADQGLVLPNTQPMQSSYNKPDNWVERNRIGLEKVKEQLETCTYSAMNETNLDLHLIHNSHYYQLMDGEEPIVWHESVLDEYWNQLEAKIDGRKQQEIVIEIEGIEIKNIEMKKDRLAALVAFFCNGRAKNSSNSVSFNNANLCKEGIVSLSKLVEVSSELQYLYLEHNRIDSMESARCLSRSLKSHTCIAELHLNHCDFGSSPEILLVILQSDVSLINLEHNNIDSLGAVKIAEYLEGDPPIEYLYLEHNRLNDDDAVLISQALKRNTHLDTLYLHTNNLTSIGVKALLNCVFDSSSLNAISESNHTLTEMNIFLGQMSDNLTGCIDRLLRLDRTQKILLALQDKESLLKYLANIPVELMPEVLAFSQQHGNSRQHRYLNIVYSTMRWWNMPMLYSHHKLCGATMPDTKRKRDNY